MTEEQILARLRAAGHRVTAPRRRLVDILLKTEGPLTAEEIHRRARRAKVGADLSTVYRNLATFCEAGWLEALPGANGERYYQLHNDAPQTMSVLCLDCGKITSVASDSAAPLNAAVRSLGFNAESLRVTLAAHCEHVCPRRPGDK
jgi:Fur family ferric uptake transcriptional regulator